MDEPVGVARVEVLRHELGRRFRWTRVGDPIYVLTSAVVRQDGTGEFEVIRVLKGQEKKHQPRGWSSIHAVHPTRYCFDLNGVPQRRHMRKAVVQYVQALLVTVSKKA